MRNVERIGSPKNTSNRKSDDTASASRTVKKPEQSKEAKVNGTANMKAPTVGPIQFPASFDTNSFKYKGDETSDLKLEFTFDAELAKLTEEKSDTKEPGEVPKPIPLPNQTAHSAPMTTATSPATDDLNLKIALVKNVWESMPVMPPVFEHGRSTSSTASPNTVTEAEVSSSVASAQAFTSFTTSIAESMSSDQDASRSHSHKSDHIEEKQLGIQSLPYSEPSVLSRNSASEQSNVCKVSCQQGTLSMLRFTFDKVCTGISILSKIKDFIIMNFGMAIAMDAN